MIDGNKSNDTSGKDTACETIDWQLVPFNVCNRIPIAYLKKNNIFPVRSEDDVLIIGSADIRDMRIYEHLSVLLECRIEPVLIKKEEITNSIHRYEQETAESSTKIANDLVDKTEDSSFLSLTQGRDDLLDVASKPPIIKFVNMILFEAIKSRATDVHIQPEGDSVIVRYRIDGVLHQVLSPPPGSYQAVLSRIKVISGLNVSERRLPQDGRISFQLGKRQIEVRVSIIPTIHGERAVLRILDRETVFRSLDDLGLPQDQVLFLKEIVSRPSGLLFVTGPTGSGKTTTLYAALSGVRTSEKNVITIEDPVEYKIDNISQIQVKTDIGMTFADGLRSILRQDPDVIMVGEVRDTETAQIAVQSAVTGHLVLSTLHTSSALEAIARLIDLGVEKYMIQSALTCVIAQRLVRTNCSYCAAPAQFSPELLDSIGYENGMDAAFMRGAGCDHCMQTGYLGRTGLFETLIIDDEIRSMLTRPSGINDIRPLLKKRSSYGLMSEGLAKVCSGVTTPDEVLAVMQE